MKISVLASGSKGNATLVQCGDTNIVVDVGISTKSLKSELAKFGVPLDKISAIIVTHAHSDHFTGLETLLKKISVPVFTSEETASSIDLCFKDSAGKGVFSPNWNFISPGSPFTFRDLLITPFEVPHDANGAMAYTIEHGNCKIGIATDLGCITNSVKYHLTGCDALVLEMNHDFRMLQESDRPYGLKTRITSKLGHLSNDQAVEFLESVDTSRLKYLFPAHISGDCNDFSCIMAAILSMEKKRGFEIVRTYQDAPTKLIDLSVNNF